jgi:iron only hydrogenase large subunit-like protein
MKNDSAFQFYHTHRVLEERCSGCMKCIRICPTEAIRVQNNKVNILPELCIDCGECIRVCPENVFVSMIDELVDFDHFKYLIAIPSLVLYTQFGPEINPGIIHQAIKNIGFDEVIDTSDVFSDMAFSVCHHIEKPLDIKPMIFSYCPTIVRLVQVSYPNLVNFLSPFEVPQEILAKRIKQTYPKKLGIKKEEIAVVYITPCMAKIVSIKQPAEKGHSYIDSTIPIKDIYNLILPEITEISEIQEKNTIEELKYFYYKSEWSIYDYISSKLGLERCLTVTGIDHAKNVLDDIEQSKLRNIDIIGVFACEKECLGGAFCVENPYISRYNSILLEKKYDKPKYDIDKDKALQNYKKGYYFLENPILARSTRSSKPDIATSIKRMRQKERISMKLPHKNCGLCGAPTCDTFAKDCAHGKSDLTDCAFFSDKFRK